jgi:DNA-directed RNA polymerase subunit RPC12/RpoP
MIEIIKNDSYTKCELCGSDKGVKAINFGGKIKPIALCNKCREKVMLVLSDEQNEEFQNSDLAYELELMGE